MVYASSCCTAASLAQWALVPNELVPKSTPGTGQLTPYERRLSIRRRACSFTSRMPTPPSRPETSTKPCPSTGRRWTIRTWGLRLGKGSRKAGTERDELSAWALFQSGLASLALDSRNAGGLDFIRQAADRYRGRLNGDMASAFLEGYHGNENPSEGCDAVDRYLASNLVGLKELWNYGSRSIPAFNGIMCAVLEGRYRNP